MRTQVKCKGLISKCRNCERKFQRNDPTSNCPDCGTSRECSSNAVVGFNYCHQHGGPHASIGYYGKESLVDRFPLLKLAEKYKKMQRDGRLLSNRSSMEMVRGRIQQLAERIDFEEAPDRMEKLNKLWVELREAENNGNGAETVVLKSQIDEEFRKAYTDYAAWKQMFEAIDLDRKLVESEVKVVKEIKAILTAEDAYNLVAKLLAIILRVFPEDPRKLRQVQFEFTKLIGDQPIDIPMDEPTRKGVLDLEAEEE